MQRFLAISLILSVLSFGCKKEPQAPKAIDFEQPISSVGNFTTPDNKRLSIAVFKTARLAYKLFDGGECVIDSESNTEESYSAAQRWMILYDKKKRLWVCSKDFTSRVWSIDSDKEYHPYWITDKKDFIVNEMPKEVYEFGI